MATGRPLRTEYDRTQNYKDYMKNLNLQIKNNKTNYDANILYKNTGVPTQPLDTRTYAEKHADIAQLKVNLRSELRVLLDDNVINEVFQELNDEQIQFLAGVATSLIAELKPKYTLGMTSHHFVDILDKKIRHEHDFSQMSEMMGTLADQLDTIADNMVTGGMMEELIDTVEHSKFIRTGENQQIVNFLRSINREIGQTQDLMNHISNIRSGEAQIAENYARTAGQEAIHTQDILTSINDKILSPDALYQVLRAIGTENSEAVEEALIEQFQHIPTITQVERFIDRIQQADRTGDTAGLDEVLRDIRGDFAMMGDRMEAYNEELTGAIEQSATAQAQAMSRMRLGIGAELGGIRGDVEGLRGEVGVMNETIREDITGLRTDMRNNTAELAIQLTNLYDNIQRQSTLLGDLQGGQADIRATLQAIEQAINMLQGLGEVNVTQLLDMENRIAGINTQVMTLGVTPAVVEETRAVLSSLEQPSSREADLPQSEYDRERKIDKERPIVGFIREDIFPTLSANMTREYLKKLWNLNNQDLRDSMGVHMGLRYNKVKGKDVLQLNGVTFSKVELIDAVGNPTDALKDLRRNYKNISGGAEAVISIIKKERAEAEVPIFAETTPAYSEKVYSSPRLKTPSEGGRPTTSEAVGDVFRRTTPRGVSPRGETPISMSAFETPSPENLYRTSRSVSTPPTDIGGNPEQLASTPPHIKKGFGILSKHRGVGVRMTGRGIAPKEKYIPLGKYLVNIHKLEHNNIISFKSPNLKSTNIQSKRVSQPVADILLHIVNGTLDEIVTDNLSEDDISYLFQLIKKCELENFLDGKAENKVKTKTEQEIHKFYVLQGEIVAGNDNPQLIREFKASLLTMMNEGKLSKKEAGDVLIQMSLLGI